MMRHQTQNPRYSTLSRSTQGLSAEIPLRTLKYSLTRELEDLLSALLQENGIFTDDVPSNYQNLRNLVSKFGTTSLEQDRIQGYSNRLKSAMEKFNVSGSSLTACYGHNSR